MILQEKVSLSLSSEIKIPVFVINWNSIDVTEKCIEHLRQNTERSTIQLVIIDNGSSQLTEQKRLCALRQEKKIDNLFIISEHIGFSKAFNIATQITTGHYFCYVSYDCFVESMWFEMGMKALLSNVRVGAVCSNVNGMSPNYSYDPSIKHFYGAIMFFKRDVWYDVGFFDDENFSPAYGEEIDWGYRAIRKGYDLKIATHSRATHVDGYLDKKMNHSSKIYAIRLIHRIQYRLLNWSIKDLLRHWKTYLLEMKYDVKLRRLHLLIYAFWKNLLYFDALYRDRQKRLMNQRINFKMSYHIISSTDGSFVIHLNR